MQEYIFNVIQNFNNSRIISAIAMLLLNFGSRYITMELSQTQEKFLSSPWFRRIIIFVIIFTTTRDMTLSIFVTFLFIIINGLSHDESKYCLVPKTKRIYNDEKKVTPEEILYAKNILINAEKQEKQQISKLESIKLDNTIKKNRYKKSIGNINFSNSISQYNNTIRKQYLKENFRNKLTILNLNKI